MSAAGSATLVSQYLGTLLYEQKYEDHAGYVTVIVIAAVSGFLLSLELRYIYRRLWTASAARDHRRRAAQLLPVRAGLARHHQLRVPDATPTTRWNGT